MWLIDKIEKLSLMKTIIVAFPVVLGWIAGASFTLSIFLMTQKEYIGAIAFTLILISTGFAAHFLQHRIYQVSKSDTLT